MTTKKLLITIIGIVVGLGLLVTLFAGAIVGIAFYSISNSEAASTAKRFLKQNERLKEDVGEVKDFGSFVTGSINTQGSDGTAMLNLKVIGARRATNATVGMVYTQSRAWRVTEASFVNASGQTVQLID